MSARDSEALRMMLLQNAGITLDEHIRRAPRPPTDRPEPVVVDPARVREILVAAGAPERDLEWLVESCPSVWDAMKYTPTREM